MLTLHIVQEELYDEVKEEFVTIDLKLELEHSLVSLSKWESKFEKPFLAKGDRSAEEALGYVQAMILTPDVSPDVVHMFSRDDFQKVNEYIDAKMTATWFSEMKGQGSGETITSELIYFWMNSYGIPLECERWHLNRLFTLIRIHHAKNQKPKKMSRGEIARRNRELNAQRKAQMGTSG